MLADPARIDQEFCEGWLPYFCRSGQREASLEEFNEGIDGWLPLVPVISLPQLTGEILLMLCDARAPRLVVFDGWGWRE